MSHSAPLPYKCIKCDYEFNYSPDEPFPSPVLGRNDVRDDGSIVYHSIPVCPVCFGKFLQENIGLGYCTMELIPGGSEYDKAKAEK